ncbi:c-type cytochrome [Swaminathania salitolerans]|uniref:Cytochrome c n=1 Tax=Swaminathania salitolerans TaxID=182838 RepID=A0A511BKI5_9PROT|nr:cytochrome c [Swaminathania salitolerans]GBQ09691.1 gluconate 2-dehydrogenase, cytochrome c subunit [Swaminathania salitolerans LMG 21291]GEL00880.1 cytochrome c [Swaminathania salitolerans]
MKKPGCLALLATLFLFPAAAQAAPEKETQLIEKGRYLAAASDCAACHTHDSRHPYAGGNPFLLPIGTLYAPNITPDRKAGIGDYTEADFSNALRRGIGKGGKPLYPAMPFPSYARMSDADIHALWAYFHNDVAPDPASVPANKIPWPLSMRWPMTLWRIAFAPTPAEARKSAERHFPSQETARGAYLVEGPGHCGACHTPRAITFQEKALSSDGNDLYLSGGAAVDGWTPVNLRQDNRTGLGRWREEDIVAFLETGRNLHGSAFGGMTDAIVHGTQHLTDQDLRAIAHYLKTSLPARKGEAPWTYDPAVAKALQQGTLPDKGARLYVDRCAACHRTDGHGYAPAFPPLAGNPVVMNPDPGSLILIVLRGSTLPPTEQAPSPFTMPGFASLMSDRDVAEVVTFIRRSWGNNARVVTQDDVRTFRKHNGQWIDDKPPSPMNRASSPRENAP